MPQNEIKVDEVVNMGMANENRLGVLAFLDGQCTGISTLTDIVIGMVVYLYKNRNIFIDLTLNLW